MKRYLLQHFCGIPVQMILSVSSSGRAKLFVASCLITWYSIFQHGFGFSLQRGGEISTCGSRDNGEEVSFDRTNPDGSGEKHGQLIIDERLEENETN